MRFLRAAAAAACGAAAYSFVEPYRRRLQVKEVLVGPGRPALEVLHLADIHLKARNRSLKRWVEALPDRLEGEPDLILATGDMIDDDSGIDPLLEALAGFRARLGKFYVRGSHDLFRSRYRPPTKYFRQKPESPRSPLVDTPRLEAGLQGQGWVPLTNRTEILDTAHGSIRLAGVDDPYLRRHTTDHIARGDSEVLALGLVHSPDVVTEWVLNGFDLIVAGHTHGGQLRLPLKGALVTNSSLPAPLASGLSRVGDGWLHVSPGLGTSKFTPVRFLCRPEATLLQLRPTLV